MEINDDIKTSKSNGIEDVMMEEEESNSIDKHDNCLEINISSNEWNNLKKFISGKRKRLLVGFDNFLTKKLQTMHNFSCCLKRISNWFKSENSRKGGY